MVYTKSRLLVICIILQSCVVFGQKAKKAVFIIADGIPADVLEKIATPALDAIGKAGGYTHAHVGGEKNAYSQTPTISAVGYNSLLTGTWVNKHNVWDNDIKAPNYNYWTLFRFLETVTPQKKTAIFSTWLDNRTRLVADGLPASGNIHIDYHLDGLELDTVHFPHDAQREYLHKIDEEVAKAAAACIKSDAPDLTWVYLEFTDDMGHKYGDHEKLHTAIQYMDKQVQQIWEAIQHRQKNFNEEWVIYITTDHGRDSITGKGHGGQSDRERNTCIVSNAKGLNEYFFKGRPGIVDIMPSIASFLGIKIPRHQAMEIDGVPLTGKLSVADAHASLQDNNLTVKWKSFESKGAVKVWLATSNNFKTGGKGRIQIGGAGAGE